MRSTSTCRSIVRSNGRSGPDHLLSDDFCRHSPCKFLHRLYYLQCEILCPSFQIFAVQIVGLLIENRRSPIAKYIYSLLFISISNRKSSIRIKGAGLRAVLPTRFIIQSIQSLQDALPSETPGRRLLQRHCARSPRPTRNSRRMRYCTRPSIRLHERPDYSAPAGS